MQWRRDNLLITDEVPAGAVDATHTLLQTTYWSHTRPRRVVEQIIGQSLCFFLMRNGQQIGFGRVISDYTTTSWIADVVLDPSQQGQGIGSWLMRCIMEHPRVSHTQFALQTGSAHDFYQRLGFARRESLMSTAVDYLSD